MRLDDKDYHLYATEHVRLEIEQKEPTVVGFFILQYAKLGKQELLYCFHNKCCDVANFEELEMDTDSHYLELYAKHLFEWIRLLVKKEWDSLRNWDCRADVSANSTTFFSRTCCTKHWKDNKQKPGCFTEEFRCTGKTCLWSKTHCCYNSLAKKKHKLSNKLLNKRMLADGGDICLSRSGKLLENIFNVTHTIRSFHLLQHAVATFDQNNKKLSYFSSKRKIQPDGIHTCFLIFDFNYFKKKFQCLWVTNSNWFPDFVHSD